MSNPVRVRMAPSPTGPVHIGNLHTAIFNWLLARRYGGSFILRLEDTDPARSERRWIEVLYSDMRWLGLDWDEGPDIGGPYGPYLQSERIGLYRRYVEALLDSGRAYPCFCSEEELRLERRAARAAGSPYRYSGRCRHLGAGERQALEASKRPKAIRFRVPESGFVRWNDLIRGWIAVPAREIGDFVLIRSNGVPVYNFAVVVDDALMHVTHVVRGEDHIANTPAQLLLYEALGFTPPAFGHIGHLTLPKGKKFSKREGTGSVLSFREKGYLSEALFNYLCHLGWAPEDGREILSREEIVRSFDLSHVSSAPAVFDEERLRWFNAYYMRHLPPAVILDRALPYLEAAGLVESPLQEDQRAWWEGVVDLARTQADRLTDLTEACRYFVPGYRPDLRAGAKQGLGDEGRGVLRRLAEVLDGLSGWEPEAIEEAFGIVARETGASGRRLYLPVRLVLTGRVHGPELVRLIPVLGREEVMRRFATVLSA